MLVLTIKTIFFNFCIKIQKFFGNFIHNRAVLKSILNFFGYYEKNVANTACAYYNIAALHPQG